MAKPRPESCKKDWIEQTRMYSIVQENNINIE